MDQKSIWSQRYGDAGEHYLFGTEPNRFLAHRSALLENGQTALSIADGEGRNSVWLAEQGLRGFYQWMVVVVIVFISHCPCHTVEQCAGTVCLGRVGGQQLEPELFEAGECFDRQRFHPRIFHQADHGFLQGTQRFGQRVVA